MKATALIAAAVLCALSSNAEARPRRSVVQIPTTGCSDPIMRPCGGALNFEGSFRHHHDQRAIFNKGITRKSLRRSRLSTMISQKEITHHNTVKPRAWCGWFGRFNFVHRDPGQKFNLARNWAGIGSNAGGPAVGVIVVWRHHVGKIVGRTAGQWIVHSGNDGGRVRTRPRSVSNAIAFRWP